MADHNFQCGDLLRCINPYHAEQLRIVGETGVVMGTKPHHIHLWFESQRRSYWITYDLLRRVQEPEISPLVTRIRNISYLLKAEEWELEETEETHRLLCYVDEVPFETLVELRSYLDIDYHALALGPEGMGRMIARVEWAK